MKNEELYSQFMELYKAGNWDALRAMLDSDVESENIAPDNTPIAGNRTGIEAFMDYLVTSAEPTCDYDFLEAHTLMSKGEVVVALGRERYRVKSTGKYAETPFTHETHWRDGKLYFWREYYDTAAMRDAYEP